MSSMQPAPFKSKKRVSIFLTEEKEKELKMKAIQAGMSLSQYLEAAGTISPIKQVTSYVATGGAVSLNDIK